MKVILLDNVRSVGKVGDVKDVRDGFARNFLFPSSLAKLASEGMIRDVEQMKAKKLAAYDLAQKDAQTLADTLKEVTIELTATSNERGTLFAAIEASDISRELSEKAGAKVDPRHIIIDTPIKALGDHVVHVELTEEVTVDMKVTVTRG